jgi:hypothetical protein
MVFLLSYFTDETFEIRPFNTFFFIHSIPENKKRYGAPALILLISYPILCHLPSLINMSQALQPSRIMTHTNALYNLPLRGMPACGRQEMTQQCRINEVRLPRLRAETLSCMKHLV